jgi:RimJ/RimL family protein N-acetyltransferase
LWANLPAGERIALRELTRADLLRIRTWRASRELYRWLVGDFRPSSAAEEEAWFARYQSHRGRERRYAICLAASGEHIGNFYLLGIDASAGLAELHIFIADPLHRRSGHGAAALARGLDIAFGELGLERVKLAVLEDNAAAIALYEKTGFIRVGTRAHRKDGGLRTVLDMELCRADYRPR